ncbi:helix-turn-helix transcriptional regulator [Glycomyces dulcitolivorans]|uniref:helix-turn-helix transcriptional regulator n=1 Tax=Glycomyces dulcitolivorans TaxID=2200759 RepID=UPI0018E50712|nr:AraC family transcriptional regulator [Glycomyces dulcitolivorans]
MRSSGTWDQAEHLLLWVRTGSAFLHMGDQEFRLAEGEGVWIPAEAGTSWEVVTEPGTVAFPLLTHPSATAGVQPEPRRFAIPDDWQDWLIQHFNFQVTPLSGRGYSQDALVDLIHGSRTPATEGETSASPVPRDALAMPKGGSAGAVAEELVRDPALRLTVREWATRVLSSPRSLRRDFLAATGLTFEQWRLRCRLNAAVEFLSAGYDVDQVVARVGFASRSGLTRAFKQHYGSTPHQLSRRLAAGRPAGEVSERAAAARQADDLVRMARGDGATTAPDLLPAARTTPHANHVHVLSWMYRGSGYLDIGDRRHERQRGVATWIPADLEHTTGIRENSISLPIGTAGTGDLALTEPLHVRFPPAWDDYLMFCSISSRSALKPDGHDPDRIIDLFAEQLAEQRALTVPMPTHPGARDAALDYLRRIGTPGEAAAPDLTAEIHRLFRDETGMSFARWRYAARMRIARDLLTGGAKPSAVARRVGYAHLPTFSAAFSRFHGMSPREYRDHQADTRH